MRGGKQHVWLISLFKMALSRVLKCCSGAQEGCKLCLMEELCVLEELHSSMSCATSGQEFSVNELTVRNKMSLNRHRHQTRLLTDQLTNMLWSEARWTLIPYSP